MSPPGSHPGPVPITECCVALPLVTGPAPDPTDPAAHMGDSNGLADAGERPAPLTVAVSLAGIEALVLVLLGILELFALTGERVTMGLSTTAFFWLYGAGLAFCAWRLALLHSWARAPVVLAQLIQLGVAWSFKDGDTVLVAAALAIVALVVIAGILHPRSIAALAADD